MKKDTTSIFETIFEIIGWIGIMLSPLLILSFIGVIIYAAVPNGLGVGLLVICSLSGLIIGAFWATKAYRKKGTMHLLSRVSASPELDEKPKEEEPQSDSKS